MGEVVADSGGFFEGGTRFISGLGPDKTLGYSPASRTWLSRVSAQRPTSPLGVGRAASLILFPNALFSANKAFGDGHD